MGSLRSDLSVHFCHPYTAAHWQSRSLPHQLAQRGCEQGQEREAKSVVIGGRNAEIATEVCPACINVNAERHKPRDRGIYVTERPNSGCMAHGTHVQYRGCTSDGRGTGNVNPA